MQSLQTNALKNLKSRASQTSSIGITKEIKFISNSSAERQIEVTLILIWQKAETISHLVSECSKLAQREWKKRHDNVAQFVHWQLCSKGGFGRADRWYNQQPEAIIEMRIISSYGILRSIVIE